MSYTIFLLLNVNHETSDLFPYLEKKLEQTSPGSFCFDQSPDIFFTLDYLKEENDTSLCIDIPYGAEEAVLKEVFDLLAYIEERIQYRIMDPQLGRILKLQEADQIIDKYRSLNLDALKNYADGHHFLRNVEVRNGRKVMVEAIKFKEETWQNHCSVGLAFARIGNAEGARKHFEKALEMDPQNSGIMHALGVTCFNQQDYQKAKELLVRAVKADPENKPARDLLKDCETKLKSVESK
jgi:tetratricopeptide (TPR) repeat protein